MGTEDESDLGDATEVIDLRALDRDTELIRLELAEQVVGGGPAVDREPGQRDAGLAGHHVDDVADLVGDGLDGGADQVGPSRPAGDADDQPAGVGVFAPAVDGGDGMIRS